MFVLARFFLAILLALLSVDFVFLLRGSAIQTSLIALALLSVGVFLAGWEWAANLGLG